MIIIVEDGNVFHGTFDQWADCFFTNNSVEEIEGFCKEMGWKLEFVEDDEGPARKEG